MPTGSTYTLKPGRPTPGSPNLLRHPIASDRGTGILACYPSTTPFGLALGTDSPCADERCAGNLGLTARGLFTLFIATHVSIRTSDTSSNPHESPSQAYGTLSYRVSNSLKSLPTIYFSSTPDSIVSGEALASAAAASCCLTFAERKLASSSAHALKRLQVNCLHPRFRCTV